MNRDPSSKLLNNKNPLENVSFGAGPNLQLLLLHRQRQPLQTSYIELVDFVPSIPQTGQRNSTSARRLPTTVSVGSLRGVS